MKKPKPLDYRELCQKLSPAQLDFKTTDKLKPISGFVGQERALEALIFGIGIKSHGYNLYGMGPTEINKHLFVNQVLEPYAEKAETPPDWCYIHNFEVPAKPIALQLPPGMGNTFQQDMKQLVDEALTNILTVFESDEYRTELKKINNYFKIKRLRRRKRFKLKNNLNKIPHLYKEMHDQEKNLQLKLLTEVISPIIIKFKKKYSKIKEVIDYLTAVQTDIIEHVDDFIKPDEKTNLLTFSLENPTLTRYKVNVLVDNSKAKGAPIIFEDTPTHSNLICRVEHTAEMGVLVTNFTLIKAGALHRANGGYLIIEARKLKKNRDAWEALKSALYTNEIKVEPLQNPFDVVKPVSLEPTPIPLNIKVILLGDRNTYYAWSRFDRDFTSLFKVPVDFDEEVPRNKSNIHLYARMVSAIVKKHKLRTFDASAVAAIIDYSTRLAEDKEKLSTYIRYIENIIIESDYWTARAQKKTVTANDVKKAIAADIRRMDRSRELYYDDINRNFIIIHTEGRSLGQINCLSVRRVGNFAYGHPTRATARIHAGKGQFIDIQREIKMSGPLHNKAGLTIANFLASRFNPDTLFSVNISVAFEQLYCWTDGDSASVGELCAILSALSDVPIYQSLAVTGSIDQYGMVQAIGGVNEKIEGFFDICKEKGLNGKQGVIIPEINIKNLMLRDDIIEAAKAKQFFIYPIKTIDQAVALLMGHPAGSRGADGHYSQGTIYERIEKRLEKFAKNVVLKIK